MTGRPVRTLLVVLATLAAVAVGTAAPATADTENHQDPRGDVARISTARAPFDGLDIVSVHNSYGNGRLVLSTTLAHVADRNFKLTIVVMAPDGTRYRGYVRAAADGVHGSFGFTGTPGSPCRERDSFQHRTLKFVFTDTCFRGVPWVRVASFSTRGADDGTTVFRDDAHQGRVRTGDPLRFGPRLDYTP